MKVIGVQFNSAIKVYDFLPGRHKVEPRDWVIVETFQGAEIGRVVYVDKEIKASPEEAMSEVLKVADTKDLARWEKMKSEGSVFLKDFRNKILKLGLEAKPVAAEYSFDGEKVIFYFVSEKRVYFRDLIKDLSKITKKQVIMRQIGPRDGARMLNGYGICGEELCCRRFMTKMNSVTMDMAREQYESNVNVNKVTGVCNRLMCCLAFEANSEKRAENK
jgi:cell fate regulator YaaT (PSP1 superfamily)